MKNDKTKMIFVYCGVLAFLGLAAIVPMVWSTTNTKMGTDVSQEKDDTRIDTETKVEPIEYTSSTVEDANLDYGKTEVRTKGVKGEKPTYYKVTYKNDVEISREKVDTKITKQPVNEVIAKGTKIIWKCVDVTSYDRNPYNDNRCTNSLGETIYTYDSDAERLDSTYRAGTSGAGKYNF